MTKEETIQVLQSIEDRAIDFPNMTECDWVAIAAAKRHLAEGAAEALKDMPKWDRATEDLQIGCLVWDELRNIHLYMNRVSKGELYISIADILRLPGSPKEGEE